MSTEDRYERHEQAVARNSLKPNIYQKMASVATDVDAIKGLIYDEDHVKALVHVGYLSTEQDLERGPLNEVGKSLNVYVSISYNEVEERTANEVETYLKREVVDIIERTGLGQEANEGRGIDCF